ncbi:HAD hydrolase-like protein [Rhodovastum atsumiense]|uniref:HAD hydrolase-like protein n=1 Tax=Rhodovastum atsumiense TaxID=504468 RepID=A0A5M6IUH4_9PROT|nr:HAD hydrolase-like protein [Rhodovastum atsumiense]KAA5611936.1 HAD hydrolase-like protein [Rhodovastum atsumiense]CAH2598702.1 HAD hydrolase-like protein [Rhodovastum atsumiense]
MTPRYRLVIFDSDGTLTDSFPWFQDVINDVAEHFGFARLDDARLEALRSLGARETLQELGVPRWQLPFIVRHMRRLKARDHHRMRLFPGVPATLRRLKECGVTLAVVSSDVESNVRRTLGPTNAWLIDHYACGASVFGKSARMRHLLRQAGFRPGEAIAIGDEIRDVEAAHSLGIAFGAVSWGYTQPEALAAQAPSVLFSTLDEILVHVTGTHGTGGRPSI